MFKYSNIVLRRYGIILVAGLVCQLGLLKTNAAAPGSVVAWGINSYGQTTIPVAAQGGVIAVAAGTAHTVALKNDGTVVAWGDNSNGQTVVPPAVQGRIKGIAAGGDSSIGLKDDGTVVVWGVGGTSVPAGLSGVKTISAFGTHIVALKTDGTVVEWGISSGGTLMPAGLIGVTAVAAGDGYTLALKSNGSVVAWGTYGYGETTVPLSALSEVIAIAVGVAHSVALKNDGTVVAWGEARFGATDVPKGLKGVVAIAAGNAHTVALKSDGSVVAWGHNSSYASTAAAATIPQGLSGVTAIAGGGRHSVAIVTPTPPTIISKPTSMTVVAGQTASFSVAASGQPLYHQWFKDGVSIAGAIGATYNLGTVLMAQAGYYTVVVRNGAGSATSAPPALLTVNTSLFSTGSLVAWGGNGYGETTVPLAAQSGLIAISAGNAHTVALKADGSVLAWGYNNGGQTNVPALLDGVVAIAAGYNHTVALKNDGAVVAWGSNGSGQSEVPVAAKSGVVAISAGREHSLALKVDGSVVAWGNGGSETSVPTGLSGIVAIAAGGFYSLALKSDGSVVGWGSDVYFRIVPTGLNSVVAIAAGASHSLALKNDGSVFAWGSNVDGETNVPPGLSGVVAVAAGNSYSLALKSDGSVVAWGRNDGGRTTVPAAAHSGVVAIAAGSTHALALVAPTRPTITTPPSSMTVMAGQTASFTVSATGYPLNYQWRKDGVNISGATAPFLSLGIARPSQAGSYTVVVRNAVSSITNSLPAVLAVLPPTPGTATAWGGNFSGQVTGIPTVAYPYFAEVNSITVEGHVLTDVIAIAAGNGHSVALRNTGSVVAWGTNDVGQVSVPAAARSGVVAIAAGGSATMALKTDGSIVAWGDNSSSQTNVPEEAKSGVATIAVGGGHMIALKNTGSVIAWGRNNAGQTNVPVAAQDGVVAIAAGTDTSVALKYDGSVVVWGWNYSGQTSVPVAAQSGVVGIAAGWSHILAVKSDGSVLAWGEGVWGQTKVPTDLNEVVAVAAGFRHSLALKSDGSVVAWGQDYFGHTMTVPSTAQHGVIAISTRSSHNLALGRFPAVSLISPNSVVRRESFSLMANVSGDSPFSYQWQRAGVDIPGATGASLTVSAGEATTGSATYSVVVQNPYGQASASTTMNVVTAIRRLPAGYWPSVPLTVELHYSPKIGTSVHTITEQLPIGKIGQLVPVLYNASGDVIAYQKGSVQVSLVPSGINEDGFFDAASGTIKWGPFFDDTPRVLRYTLTPPVGWGAPISFAGTLSQDGQGTSLPNDALSLYNLHPADNAPPVNHIITLSEVLSYATAWRRSLLWPVPPNPDDNYVTQAGLILRKGEYYDYVPGTPPPVCWQPAPRPPGVVQASQSAIAPQSSSRLVTTLGIDKLGTPAGSAIRTVPGTVNPAAPFGVTILLTPATDTAVSLVEEQLPVGWSATSITQGGSLDTALNKVKWGPYYNNTSQRTLAYTAVPPDGAAGRFSLSGLAGFDGTVLTIAGQSQVALGVSAVPPVLLLQPPALVGGAVQLDFTLESGSAPSFTLMQATAIGGSWTSASNATLTINAPGSSYRFTLPVAPDATFFRIRVP